MNLPPEAYAYLGVSLLAAVLLDYALVRLCLELLRPPSMYLFLVGRVGKLLSAFAWIYFFHSFWYPQFVAGGGQPPGPLVAAAYAFLGVMLLLAVVTLPRAPRASRENPHA